MPMFNLPSPNVGPGGLRPPRPRGPALAKGIPTGPVRVPGQPLPGPGALSAPTALVAGAPRPPGTPGLAKPRRVITGRAKELYRPKKPKMAGVSTGIVPMAKAPRTRNSTLGVV